ncbi:MULTISPECIES: isochorismatase family protein [Agrobacterium]|uniref:isochorismatase family protein n=1 Tax=Agrobacterium TaxID=357 RepID=UPI003BA1626D
MKHILSRRDVFRAGALAAAAVAVSSMPALAQTGQKESTSRIDPNDVQLLLGDLQVGLVSGSKTNSPDAISRAASVLAKVGTTLELPTLFSVVDVAGGSADLIPGLKDFADRTNTIKRTPISPFGDTATVAALHKTPRRTLVISGFAAEAVVLQAALDALATGYRVYFVVDTIGSASERTERAAFEEMAQAGAIPTSVLSLSTRLVKDFVSTPGSEVFAALGPILKG